MDRGKQKNGQLFLRWENKVFLDGIKWRRSLKTAKWQFCYFKILFTQPIRTVSAGLSRATMAISQLVDDYATPPQTEQLLFVQTKKELSEENSFLRCPE